MRSATAHALTGFLLAAPGFAATATAQPAPPVIQTVLKLAETGTVMIRPDELTAALRAEIIAGNAADAQGKVNAAIAEALARAKSVSGVTISTGIYGVSRIAPNPADKTERWQASQSLELKSQDGAALLKLVGELQKSGLAVRSLGWRLSPEVARKARAEATRLALAGLRGRADEAAMQIGMAFEGFKEIRLDAERPGPIGPRLMASPMAGSAAPVAPSAEAEDISVSATAEADVLLRSR